MKIEIKDYNWRIDDRNFLDDPSKDRKGKYRNQKKKIESRQGNGYKEKPFIDYPYFKLGEKCLKEKDSLSI